MNEDQLFSGIDISVVESKDKKFRPNYKLIYCYCWILTPPDRLTVRKALDLSKETVQQAFTYFKENKISLPKTFTRKCDQWDVTFPLTPNP